MATPTRSLNFGSFYGSSSGGSRFTNRWTRRRSDNDSRNRAGYLPGEVLTDRPPNDVQIGNSPDSEYVDSLTSSDENQRYAMPI